ncbi:MAG: hypothetical protein ACREIT_11020, partial [Tepidisphaeraceae bacterium]
MSGATATVIPPATSVTLHGNGRPDEASSILAARPRRAWGDYALIAAVAFVAHFCLAYTFGFYEDDYIYSAEVMTWDWGRFVRDMGEGLVGFGNGRPFNHLMGRGLSYLGWATLGIPGMYLFGFISVATTSILLCRMLEMAPCMARPLPLLGALAFLLFPAHAARPHLNYNLCVHPAFAFFALGGICYLRGMRVWPYVLLVCVLFAYETAFLPFLALPLLGEDRGRRLVRRFAAHLACCAGVVIGVVVLRKLVGEVRMTGAMGDPKDIPWKIAWGTAIGITTSMREFVGRPIYLLRNHGAVPYACSLAVALGGGAVLAVAFGAQALRGRWHATTRDTRTALAHLARPALTGVVMLLPAYAFGFTHYPPDATFGRESAEHTGAQVGAAILVACIAVATVQLFAAIRLRYVATTLLGAYFGLLIGFSFMVQRGFERSWVDQSKFWNDVLRLCPDLSDGTTIFLDGYTFPN